MGKHDRRAGGDSRTLRLVAEPGPGLEVRRAGADDIELVDAAVEETAAADGAEGHSASDGQPPVGEDPEEFGVRVTWQSEAVKIEAAEFLIATRMQQDAKLRDSHVLADLRRRKRR